MALKFKNTADTTYPVAFLTYGNGQSDVKCVKYIPPGSSTATTVWSKHIDLFPASYQDIPGSWTPTGEPIETTAITAQTNSDPNPVRARSHMGANLVGEAYWGDKVTVKVSGNAIVEGNWATLTIDLYKGFTFVTNVLPTYTIKSSTRSYDYTINVAAYDYNNIVFTGGYTPVVGAVTGTAGTGFLEHASSGVGFSMTWYSDVSASNPGLANIGYGQPTKTISVPYMESGSGQQVYMYARAYSTDATYATIPSNWNYAGTYNDYNYYYVGKTYVYQQYDGGTYDFGRATLGTDYSTTATKSATSTGTSKTISLSTLGISSFTSGHKLRFYQATLSCIGSNVAFTSPLSYGISATITTNGTAQTGYASLYWNGTTGFTLSVYGPRGTSVIAGVAFEELLHTPS